MEMLRAIDQFDKPVRLQFQQSSTFKTVLGGIISLIVYFIFCAIFAYLYVDMSEKNNVTILLYLISLPMKIK